MKQAVFLRILMLTACVFCFFSIFKRDKKITGIVSNKKCAPHTGHSATVKSAETIIITYLNEKFSLIDRVNSKGLEISYVHRERQIAV